MYCDVRIMQSYVGQFFSLLWMAYLEINYPTLNTFNPIVADILSVCRVFDPRTTAPVWASATILPEITVQSRPV